MYIERFESCKSSRSTSRQPEIEMPRPRADWIPLRLAVSFPSGLFGSLFTCSFLPLSPLRSLLIVKVLISNFRVDPASLFPSCPGPWKLYIKASLNSPLNEVPTEPAALVRRSVDAVCPSDR